MNDSPDTLLAQLAARTKVFKEKTGLTFRNIGRLTGISEQHVCDFIAGRKGLSAESTMKLLNLIKSTKAQAEAKLTKPVTSQILHFQVEGKPTLFDGSGWIAQEGGSDDLNDMLGDITSTPKEGGEPSGDDIIDVLRQVDNFHKEAREAIANWFANYQKAKANAKGVSEGPRKIADNTTSKTPGPKGDLFGNSTEQLKRRLEFSRKMREEAEEKLRLQQEIDEEKRRWWAAKSAT